METITYKILDNTTISASIKEIKSMNLIHECSKYYSLTTSKEVYLETCKGFKREIVENNYKKIKIHDLKNDKKYSDKLQYLKNRFPYLHEGEISSFLVAWMCYSSKGKKCFYVTDDKKMKKCIERIKKDNTIFDEWKELFGLHDSIFGCTGTIGLISRMREKKLLNEIQIAEIIKDLTAPNSTFYIGETEIKLLRGD